ncbi:hypothetical protein QAD02_020907 [Eretmocerus hayati]|uniref:Uncharacterized protein n=1 Tax=Eretmocerus hayati TaxID=131215 RepID=A0ACC2PR95_9HYME|nr:hypothetical protein QAD02_020907 [Eretmocerus hayati]
MEEDSLVPSPSAPSGETIWLLVTFQYYTVIKNVKKAHQIQESGEFQEFNDDIEYILDTLRENNPNPTRCLSAFRLASKCMIPAFRMHVRAHGTVTKFFRALHDATTDQMSKIETILSYSTQNPAASTRSDLWKNI